MSVKIINGEENTEENNIADATDGLASTSTSSNPASAGNSIDMSVSNMSANKLHFFQNILFWLIFGMLAVWIAAGNGFFTLTKYSGFALEHVEFYNLEKTNRDELLAVTNFKLGESVFALDLQETKRNIDALPWVETSHIIRALPNNVHIYVTEHRPAAIWQNNGDKILVSHDGSHIGSIENFTNYDGLPVIAGEQAPQSFRLLKTILESYPELQGALRGAQVSRALRWTIFLDNGTRIHLPVRGIDEAFERLRFLDKQFQVLSLSASVIDLRAPDRAGIGKDTPVATPVASLPEAIKGNEG